MDHLVLFKDLGLGKHHLIGELDRRRVNGHFKVFEDLLLHQSLHHLHNLAHLCFRGGSADGKGIAHTRAGTDRVRDAIDSAEFGWQVDELVSVLHNDERLVEVLDLFTVDIVKVLGDRLLLSIVDEFFGDGVALEVDVRDHVDALVSPVSDHTGPDDFKLDELLELAIVPGVLPQLLDLV